MRAKTIVFRHHAPGGIDGPLPLISRSDRIPPVIHIRKTTARPAKNGDPDLLQCLHDIHPDMISRPETIIDTSPQVFGEMPVDIPADNGARCITEIEVDGLGKRIAAK